MRDDIKKRVLVAVANSPHSMRQASVDADMSYMTFRYRAKVLGVYNPCPHNIKHRKSVPKIALDEIIVEGKHPKYATYVLKYRLWDEGIKERVCECCGIGEEYNGSPLTLQLDHIDGNNRNHLLTNLRILCPNCHSQTDTYAGKNASTYVVVDVGDKDEIVSLYKKHGTIRGVLKSLGILNGRSACRKIKDIIEPYKDQYAFKGLERIRRMELAQCAASKRELPFTKEQLQQLLWRKTITDIARDFDRSDNGIRLWIKKWKLNQPPRGYFLRKENITVNAPIA